MLTSEYIRDLLTYDPGTGEFVWNRRPQDHFTDKRAWAIWNTKHSGKKAGCRGHYLLISINDRLYKAQRLAWLYMTGGWPLYEIDHRDGDPMNNKWSNLRDANHQQNMANMKKPKNNSSGVKGVSWNRSANKWQARIGVNGKYVYLGVFADINDAADAYDRAARMFNGEFARVP